MDKIKILNVYIDNIKEKELLEKLQKGILITPNVDHLMKVQTDKKFYDVYQLADWVICDSTIVSLALSFLGTPIKEVIPGSSFLPAYYNYHKNNINVKIFLLGAEEGVADKAKNIINHKVGREIIVGAHSPSFGFEKKGDECQSIIEMINNTDATVLVVGVGAPKQEKWIFQYKDQLSQIKLFMALGATIDFEAGNVTRAPIIMQKLRLEWFYRLCREPKRLWRRYLIDDIPFFYHVLRQKFGLYKNPFE